MRNFVKRTPGNFKIEIAPDKKIKEFPKQRAIFEQAISKVLGIPTGMLITDESRVGDFLSPRQLLTEGEWMNRDGKSLTAVKNVPAQKLNDVALLSQELNLMVTSSDYVWKVLQSLPK